MFQPSKDQLVMKEFLGGLADGAYVLYKDIEAQTDITMDNRGKSILRSAARSLKLEYRCDIGKGVEFEGPNSAMHIVTGRVRRVSTSLKRADRTTTRMADRYLTQLPKDDRDRLLATASLFGAIQAMAKGLSNIYKPKKLATVQAQSIPDFRK